MNKNKFSTYILSIFLLVSLASCSTKPTGTNVCPKVAFLDGLERVTFFKDEASAKSSNVLFSSQMKALDSKCSFKQNGAEIEIRLNLKSHLAATKNETIVEVSYFAAAVDPDGEILAKQVFNLDIPFSPKRLRVVQEEIINPFFPGSAGNNFAGYKVLIGFQLTKSQVNFNLQNRR